MIIFRGVAAFFAIVMLWLSFLMAPFHHHTQHMSDWINFFILICAGGLLLAFAYDAFKKTAYFSVPIFSIIAGLIAPGDSKGILVIIFMLIGISIGTRFSQRYYRKKEKLEQSNEETGRKNN